MLKVFSMIATTSVLLTFAVFPSCLYAQKIDDQCDLILRRNAPTPKAYFPPNTLSDTTDRNATYLSFLLEPSLVQRKSCSAEVYRFLWLRSAHPPVAVRIWTVHGNHMLVAKYLNGKGGYYRGRFAQRRVKALSDEQWNAFVTLLNDASFWNLPTEEPIEPPSDGSFGMIHFDGASWIVEATVANRYHLLTRNSPKDKYRDMGLYLLKLSGLRIKPNEIY